jgi:hypothetical protein
MAIQPTNQFDGPYRVRVVVQLLQVLKDGNGLWRVQQKSRSAGAAHALREGIRERSKAIPILPRQAFERVIS